MRWQCTHPIIVNPTTTTTTVRYILSKYLHTMWNLLYGSNVCTFKLLWKSDRRHTQTHKFIGFDKDIGIYVCMYDQFSFKLNEKFRINYFAYNFIWKWNYYCCITTTTTTFNSSDISLGERFKLLKAKKTYNEFLECQRSSYPESPCLP